MSYDVNVGSHWDMNMTTNCVDVWDVSMPNLNLRDMDGEPASVCIPHLKEGISYAANHRHDMIKLIRGDGTWGDFGAAITLLILMLEACEKHPEAIVGVYR